LLYYFLLCSQSFIFLLLSFFYLSSPYSSPFRDPFFYLSISFPHTISPIPAYHSIRYFTSPLSLLLLPSPYHSIRHLALSISFPSPHYIPSMLLSTHIIAIPFLPPHYIFPHSIRYVSASPLYSCCYPFSTSLPHILTIPPSFPLYSSRTIYFSPLSSCCLFIPPSSRYHHQFYALRYL
jgi:hypothetical protein